MLCIHITHFVSIFLLHHQEIWQNITAAQTRMSVKSHPFYPIIHYKSTRFHKAGTICHTSLLQVDYIGYLFCHLVMSIDERMQVLMMSHIHVYLLHTYDVVLQRQNFKDHCILVMSTIILDFKTCKTQGSDHSIKIAERVIMDPLGI